MSNSKRYNVIVNDVAYEYRNPDIAWSVFNAKSKGTFDKVSLHYDGVKIADNADVRRIHKLHVSSPYGRTCECGHLASKHDWFGCCICDCREWRPTN